MAPFRSVSEQREQGHTTEQYLRRVMHLLSGGGSADINTHINGVNRWRGAYFVAANSYLRELMR